MSVLAATLPPFSLNLLHDMQVIWHYDFMQRALLVGTLLSVITGLVGTFVVLRHQAFAGESLSDVAFTGALGGAAFGFNPLLTLLGTTVVIGLLMGGLGERLRGRDVAIGTVLAWVLGVGALFLTRFTTQVSGQGTGFSGVAILFGNLLGTSAAEIRTLAWVGTAVLVALLLIVRPLLFASLDPDVAAARGVPVRLLGLGFMVLLAVTVSLATLTIGALLVFALLLLPAAAAQQLTTHPYRAFMLAAGLGVGITWVGIIVAFYTGYPSSVCISLLAFVVYALTIGRNVWRTYQWRTSPLTQ